MDAGTPPDHVGLFSSPSASRPHARVGRNAPVCLMARSSPTRSCSPRGITGSAALRDRQRPSAGNFVIVNMRIMWSSAAVSRSSALINAERAGVAVSMIRAVRARRGAQGSRAFGIGRRMPRPRACGAGQRSLVLAAPSCRDHDPAWRHGAVDDDLQHGCGGLGVLQQRCIQPCAFAWTRASEVKTTAGSARRGNPATLAVSNSGALLRAVRSLVGSPS